MRNECQNERITAVVGDLSKDSRSQDCTIDRLALDSDLATDSVGSGH